MKLVTFEEYQVAKNQIIYGTEYKEYSTLENGYIKKQYTTVTDTFYEVTDTDTHITEFWSTKYPNSRYYSDKTPEQNIYLFGFMPAKQTDINTFYITLSNGITIDINKNPEYNGNIWAWKIDTQVFSKDTYAEQYLKKLITEKLTGNRIIYHKKNEMPNICGVNGSACRNPNKCNSALCSHCPIAEQFFADRDNVNLIYAF